jgi:ribonuclease HII
VYAAAVILKSNKDVRHYRDSKLLSEDRREVLFDSILAHHQASIAFAEVEEINRLNILWASMLAMRRAVESLAQALGLTAEEKVAAKSCGHVVVDGHILIPELEGFVQTAVVKGDDRVKPIAAASILAKVARDRYVREQAEKFPGYGLEFHKGYATPAHVEALSRLGPTPLHRRDFARVRELWNQSDL